jgi:hypothetical protein
MHLWEPGQPWFSPEYCAFVRDYPGTVYMSAPCPEVKNCTVYPIDEMEELFGPYFWTSSVAYMMALAITKGPEEIGLWGIDMAACPSGDTKVLTADLRWVRADSLRVGDDLIAFDEHGTAEDRRMWRRAKVLRNDPLMKPCYKLTLEDGRELICSDEHKWLTYGEHSTRWKMAKEMVTPHHRADRPTRIVKLCDTWDEDRSWGAGYLAAAFDGEGHLSQKLREGDLAYLRAGFAQRDNPMSGMVAQLMQDRGFEFGRDAVQAGMNGDVTKYSIRGGRVETMRFLGSVRPRRLLEKFAPESLGLLQREDAVAVVKAEFIGDYPVIGLKTSTGTFIAEGLASHNTEEYGYQRAGCQYMAMIASIRGIKITAPPQSDLFVPPPRYGFIEQSHMYLKARARMIELNGRKQACEQMAQSKAHETAFLQGAIDDLTYVVNTWPGLAEERDPAAALSRMRRASPVVQAAEAALASVTPAPNKGNGEWHGDAGRDPLEAGSPPA